ncbi:MAG TPA: hypothetical protein VGO51_00525 [Burkholderiaceae bacterium]|nr:hypothetical protein [Burkholderiaceae bacterium]
MRSSHGPGCGCTTLCVDSTRIGKLADRIERRDIDQRIADIGFQLIERASA